MASYKVSDADLTSIANAIRTKGSTSAELTFPAGFVTAIGRIPSGDPPSLLAKTVTANGVYYAEDDDVDGYSSVNVSTPIAVGTFTGSSSEKGMTKTIAVPYSGEGYPIALSIFPSAGSYKSGSTIYTTVQRYAVATYFMVKSNASIAPDFIDTTAEKNMATGCSIYKSSDSDATSYGRNSYMATTMFRANQSASAASVDCVRFHTNTEMQVFIANTSYGFMDGVEYTYIVLYSS